MASGMAQKLGVAAAIAVGVVSLSWIDFRVLPRLLATERVALAQATAGERVATGAALAVEPGAAAAATTGAAAAPGAAPTREPGPEVAPTPASAARAPAAAPGGEVAPTPASAAARAAPPPAGAEPAPPGSRAPVGASAEVVATIYFDSMSKRIGVRAGAQLDRVVKAVGAGQRLTLEGYADYRGDEAYNLELSQERAEAVARYLTRRGVAARRIARAPHGERDDKAAPTELWRDRRVDIRIHEGDDR